MYAHSFGSANSPTQIPPSSPATECVSSTSCSSAHRLCSHIIDHHGMLPARIPITIAAHPGTNPAPHSHPPFHLLFCASTFQILRTKLSCLKNEISFHHPIEVTILKCKNVSMSWFKLLFSNATSTVGSS